MILGTTSGVVARNFEVDVRRRRTTRRLNRAVAVAREMVVRGVRPQPTSSPSRFLSRHRSALCRRTRRRTCRAG